MRIEKQTLKIETTTSEISTKVTQVAHDQAKLRDQSQEAAREQEGHLSVIRRGVESCSLEVKGQNNILLELQNKLKMYVLSEYRVSV